ncbi:MAG: hypothetical protein PHW04_04595 [Candidatus Wallbacteria bacterium]|nr:hypothetical protein [Candidatus Wallbacteria bacterium]
MSKRWKVRNSTIVLLLIIAVGAMAEDDVYSALQCRKAILVNPDVYARMNDNEKEILYANGFEALCRMKVRPADDDYSVLAGYYHTHEKDLGFQMGGDKAECLKKMFDFGQRKKPAPVVKPKQNSTVSGLSGLVRIPGATLKEADTGSLTTGCRILQHRWDNGRGYQTFFPVGISFDRSEISFSENKTSYRSGSLTRCSSGEGLALKYIPAPGMFMTYEGYFPNSDQFLRERNLTSGYQHDFEWGRAIVAWNRVDDPLDWETDFQSGIQYSIDEYLSLISEWHRNANDFLLGLSFRKTAGGTLAIERSFETRVQSLMFSWEIPFR